MNTKKMLSVFAITIILTGCRTTQANTAVSHIQTNKRKVKTMQLLKEIKKRTETDLKKFGIKKVLLSNNRKWREVGPNYLIFTEDGKVKFLHYGETRVQGIYYLWKIYNNTLYISFPSTPLNYLQAVVEAIEPAFYSQDELERYKYALSIRTNDNKIVIVMNLILE